MKKLLLTLLLLFTLGLAVNAAEVTLTLTQSNFSAGGYNAVNQSNVQDGLGFAALAYNSNGYQFNKGKGCFFMVSENNNGYVIKSITVTFANDNSRAKIKVYKSETAYSQQHESAVSGSTLVAEQTADKKSHTFDINAPYFGITNSGTKALQMSSIAVIYEKIEEVPTECPVPVFSVANGANVYPGSVISVDKKGATSCELYLGEEKLEGDSYTVPESAIGSTITLTAHSTLNVENAEPLTATASVTVTVTEAPDTDVATFDFATNGNVGTLTTPNVTLPSSDGVVIDGKTFTNGVVSFITAKPQSSSTGTKWFYDGTCRLYRDNTLKVYVKDGYYIVSATFIGATQDDRWTNLATGDVDGDWSTYENFAEDHIWTAKGQPTEVTFDAKSGRCDFVKLNIEYAKLPENFTHTFSAVNLVAGNTQDIVVPEGAPAITFTSNDENVATVEGNTITAVGGGEATITATWPANKTWNAGRTEFKVTVTKITTSVTFGQTSVILAEKTKVTQQATVNPEGLTVAYSSKNPEIATVDAETGEVKAVKAGTATITATVGNEQYATSTANYTVTVVAEGDVNKLDGEITWGEIKRSCYGWLTIPYSFKLINYDGAAIEISMQVVDAQGNPLTGLTFSQANTSRQAEAAAATIGLEGEKMVRGTMRAAGAALGTKDNANTDDLKVIVNATVGGKALQDKNSEFESAGNNATGIEDVTVEGEGEAEYFNLQGLRVAQPEAGQLYIKRQGGKAVKVRF